MIKKFSIFLCIFLAAALLWALPAFALDPTDAPDDDDITVTNNLTGNLDTVTVTSLSEDDIVKVYPSLSAKSSIGAAVVGSGGTSATIYIDQLGTLAGSVYVTVTGSGKGESPRTPKGYDPEDRTPAPNENDISVQNSITVLLDTITVSNISAGDIVRAYAGTSAATPIATIQSAGTSALLYISQLGVSAGNVYVSVQTPSKLESFRTAKNYPKEASSTLLSSRTIEVTNNFGPTPGDNVHIPGLVADDFVRIYSTAKGTEILASATATGPTLDIPLTDGLLSASAGKIYISVTSLNSNESARVGVSYPGEQSAPLTVSAVTVDNKYYKESGGVQVTGSEDTVRISGVADGDILNIYAAATRTDKLLGPVTVTSPVDGAVTLQIGQLGTAAGRIFVTITRSNKSESPRTAVSYRKEPTTLAVSPSAISIENFFNIQDTVVVTGLASEIESVTLYSTLSGASAVGSMEVTGTSVSIPLNPGILSATGGRLYVAVKAQDMLESPRTAQSYSSEVSSAPAARNILVVNNPGDSTDTVTVTGLTVGDIVNIYDAAQNGNRLANAEATDRTMEISLPGDLGDEAGKLYVTITSVNKAESKRTAVSYLEE